MKRSVFHVVLGVLIGLGIGAATAAAAGAPVIQGIYGYLAGVPVYSVDLPANSGIHVGTCPPGNSLTYTGMANGAHVILCR